MTNIILCGGEGKRLWPLSQKNYPKQFLKLFDKKFSLFQHTILRNNNLCDQKIIVSNYDHLKLIQTQIKELPFTLDHQIILEPIQRNTAISIALACFELPPDEIVLVTPSDHIIHDQLHYEDTIKNALELAKLDHIAIFGIKPLYAETNFGYIEAANNDVLSFHEKPNFELANTFFNNPNYFWNSGIFCFKANIFLEELKIYQNEIYFLAKQALINSTFQNNITKIKYVDMKKIPSISIDYAVLEHTQTLKMISANFYWNDIGNFKRLADYFKTQFKQKHYDKTLTRWGYYTVLCNTDNYKIKYLELHPSKELSLQKHLHRSEYWIVLEGEATTLINGIEHTLSTYESIHIDIEAKHKVINNTSKDLIILEFQIGKYTEEDDIIRYEHIHD